MDALRPFTHIVGLVVLVTFVLRFLYSIYKYFLRPGKSLKKYGEWAVVTGSTDGIGEAIAIELAKQGLNIISVSRNSEKFEWKYEKDPATGKGKEIKGASLGFGLQLTEKKIKEKAPNVTVLNVEVDFKNFDAAARTKVAEACKDKKIGILINNVGESYDYCNFFHEISDKKAQALLTMNIDSVSFMTKIVLGNMVSKDGGKGKGAIVNIGSGSSLTISPLLAQYVGAKGYVEKFSRAMHYEYKSKGIDVQCQAPLMVATKLSKVKKASLFTPSPSTMAKACVRAIGYEDVISPYWGHALQIFFLNLLPDFLHGSIIMNMHLGVRKAAMKKEEQNK